MLAEAGALPAGRRAPGPRRPVHATHARGVAVLRRDGSVFVSPGQRAGLPGLGGRRRRGRGVRAGRTAAVGRPTPSRSFRGRDVFAPVTAHLARGVPLAEVGPPARPVGSLVQGRISEPKVHGDHVHGEIRMVDHFGNLALNLRRSDLEAAGIQLGDLVELRCGGRTLEVPFTLASARCRGGRTVVCEDSFRAITIAVNGGRADRALRAGSGDPVVLGRVHRLLGRPRPRSPSSTARARARQRSRRGSAQLARLTRALRRYDFRCRREGEPTRATCRGPRHRGQPPPRRPAGGLLAADPSIERVIGVDTVPPPRELATLGRTEFVRADIRNPLIAKVIAHRGGRHRRAPEHHRAAPRRRRPGVDEGDERHRHHAAARRLPEVGVGAAARGQVLHGGVRLVLPRPGAVHRGDRAAGAAPLRATRRTPSRWRATCAASPAAAPTSRSACSASPTSSARASDSPLLRYLRLPVVPTVLGFDPRVQLLHVDDALEVLRRATCPSTARHAQRRRRRGAAAVPDDPPGRPGAGAGAGAGRAAGRRGRYAGPGWSTSPGSRCGFLEFGRVVDTTRLREEFGYIAALRHGGGVRRLRPAPRAGDAGAADRGAARPRSAILDAVRAAAAAELVPGARRG